jgi:hypothetical protein
VTSLSRKRERVGARACASIFSSPRIAASTCAPNQGRSALSLVGLHGRPLAWEAPLRSRHKLIPGPARHRRLDDVVRAGTAQIRRSQTAGLEPDAPRRQRTAIDGIGRVHAELRWEPSQVNPRRLQTNRSRNRRTTRFE